VVFSLGQELMGQAYPSDTDLATKRLSNDEAKPPAADTSPTRVRSQIVRLGISLAFLAYVDRACISQAAPNMMRDLHLTKVQMGYVFSAFGFTYAALELPSGWLCDQIGARKVLTRVVISWSALTAATGLAWNFLSLFAIRLLFGAGEAGCFPGLAKAFSVWLPENERAVAEGWKAAMARWGAAFAPPLVVLLYSFIGWRQTFAVFGAFGILWSILFTRFYRDSPRSHRNVNALELLIIESRQWQESATPGPLPWRAFARSRSAWTLCIQWFCHYYGFYFYLTWLPIYLQQARGLSVEKSAILAGLPLFFAGAGTLAAGFILPDLSRSIGKGRARRLLAYISYAGAALLLLIFVSVRNPTLAILVMSLSSFVVELSTPVTWITAMDLGGSSVGTLTGAMNAIGQIGASVAPAVIGYMLTVTASNWNLAFYISAVIYALGVVCWAMLDPVTRLA
jgi:ACS family glucarate transporter-like MFS transporter